MAERRMFAKSIVLSDVFLDMPFSARDLYFILGMLADDDGFVGSPKSIMRQCGASQDDMAILLQKGYVIAFESGVIVITHWRMNNYIQNDRYKETVYTEEKELLSVKDNGSYMLCCKDVSKMDTKCIQDVSEMDTQYRLGKDRLDKDSIDKKKRFTPPTLEEVKAYCQERNNSINPKSFIDFYEAKGWVIGKTPMQDWQAAIRTWENNQNTWEKNTKGVKQNGRMDRVSERDEEQYRDEVKRYVESDEYRNGDDGGLF